MSDERLDIGVFLLFAVVFGIAAGIILTLTFTVPVDDQQFQIMMPIMALPFAGVSVGMSIAVAKRIRGKKTIRNLAKNGKEGTATVCSSSVAYLVNNVPRYRISYEYLDSNGYMQSAKSLTLFTAEEAELLEEKREIKILYDDNGNSNILPSELAFAPPRPASSTPLNDDKIFAALVSELDNRTTSEDVTRFLRDLRELEGIGNDTIAALEAKAKMRLHELKRRGL